MHSLYIASWMLIWPVCSSSLEEDGSHNLIVSSVYHYIHTVLKVQQNLTYAQSKTFQVWSHDAVHNIEICKQ